jgi:hypothetical protein
MKYQDHCKECEEKLGKPWECVHLWLDSKAKQYGGWMGHRCYYHHKEGIEEAREKWGDEAAKAAELHILSDFGYIPDKESVHALYNIEYKKEE